MSEIKEILAREILDSRGNPTVEVELTTASGAFGRAAVPSGASVGSREALELRDGDKHCFGGLGVQKAVNAVLQTIAPALTGTEVADQLFIDRRLRELDGTANCENLGANALLGVSLAAAYAAADELALPLYRYLGGISARTLPVPMLNFINGGVHSDAPLAFQEFMIRPVGADSFSGALRMASEIFHALKELLQRHHLTVSVGDEGGFAPMISGAESALDLLLEAIERAGYAPGEDATLALDCAAGSFFRNGLYDYGLMGEKPQRLATDDQISYLERLLDRYPIDSIEDPLAESDQEGWREITRLFGGRCQLVGDDLFATNVKYIRLGIADATANAVLIKPNQIGTLSDAMEAVNLTLRAGLGAVISHRSGETCDPFIADLAVAVNCGQIKAGGLCRGERLAKYNQLLRIEEELGTLALFGCWRGDGGRRG